MNIEMKMFLDKTLANTLFQTENNIWMHLGSAVCIFALTASTT
jgi:hypothetical protein